MHFYRWVFHDLRGRPDRISGAGIQTGSLDDFSCRGSMAFITYEMPLAAGYLAFQYLPAVLAVHWAKRIIVHQLTSADQAVVFMLHEDSGNNQLADSAIV